MGFSGLALTLLSVATVTRVVGEVHAATDTVMRTDSGIQQATSKGLIQMLVLTRKRTESIKIGEDIVVTVIHTSAGSVKLGIQAPANVRVLRAELGERPRNPVAPVIHVAPMDQIGVDADRELEDDLLAGLILSAELFLNQFSDDDVAALVASLDQRCDVALASEPAAGSEANDRTIMMLEAIAL